MTTQIPNVDVGSEKSGYDGVSAREEAILNGDNADETPEKQPAKVEEPDEPEEKVAKATEDVEEELEDLDTPPEDEIVDEELPGEVSFKEINKKYPQVLKEYPDLRKNYFLAKQFQEVFPTVEDATTASQKVEVFDQLDPYIAQGDLSPFINIFKEAGNGKALDNIATTILPALHKADPQLYVKTLNPEFKKLFAHAIQSARRAGDENLEAAVKTMIQFVWGGQIPADPPQQQAQDPEKQQLQQRLQQQTISVLQSKEAETKSLTEKYLLKDIGEALDPNNEMNPTLRTMVIEKIGNEINSQFEKSPKLQKEFNSLWRQYASSNFSIEARSRLIRAIRGRVKNLLPSVAQKYRNEQLLSKAEQSAPRGNKTSINQSSAPAKSRSVHITPKQAKSERMSEMDIIMAGSK